MLDRLPSHRKLVDTHLGQMHVRIVGEGDGTPLLLLHTQLIGGRLYDDAVPLLAAGRTLVIPDRIGYGMSDPAQRPHSFEEYAQATVEVLDALGIAQVDAVGVHSGGIEVVELAVAHAARVRRASVITLALFTPEEVAFFSENYAVPPPAPTEESGQLLFFWGWWKGIQPEGVGLDTLQDWTVDALRAAPNFWWTFNAAFAYLMAEQLPRVTQPFQVMAPHDDLWTQMQRAIEILPQQAELIDLPHVTNPMGIFTTHREEVCANIRRFLA